jgi:hypothetical protein
MSKQQCKKSASTRKVITGDSSDSPCRPRTKSIDRLISQFFEIVSLDEFSREMSEREGLKDNVNVHNVARTGTETSWSCESTSTNGKIMISHSIQNTPDMYIKEVNMHERKDIQSSCKYLKHKSCKSDLLSTKTYNNQLNSCSHHSRKGIRQLGPFSSDINRSDMNPSLHQSKNKCTDLGETDGMQQSRRFKLPTILRRAKSNF